MKGVFELLVQHETKMRLCQHYLGYGGCLIKTGPWSLLLSAVSNLWALKNIMIEHTSLWNLCHR